jgi:hypothetical protein
MTPDWPSSLTEALINPSFASRLVFLAAEAKPFFRNSSIA